MRVVVGQTLNFRGARWIISAIGTHEETTVASQDSDILTQEMSKEGNTQYLSKLIGEFLAGDIITTITDRITLTQPGNNRFYIYTKFEVAKEKKEDGTNGSEDSNVEASSSSTEGPRNGVEDGEAVRDTGASAADQALHSNGCDREKG